MNSAKGILRRKFRDIVKEICFTSEDPDYEQIMKVMGDVKLTERSKLIAARYVSTSEALQDIALMHGISRERVRQIVCEAYRRTRKQWWYIFD